MASYVPPNEVLTIFNYLNYNYSGNVTIADAMKLFVPVTGGITAWLNITNYLQYNGSAVPLSALTLITPGTVSASKAIIVDANKDITGIRYLTATNLTGTLQTASQTNITSVGTLSSLSVSGSLNLTGSNQTIACTNPIGVNNALTISGTGTIANTSGMSFWHVGASATSYINSYNYNSSTKMNLDVCDGSVFCTAGGLVGINKKTGINYNLDISGSCNVTNDYLINGVSTNLSYLSGVTLGVAAASKVLTLDNLKAVNSITSLTTQYLNPNANSDLSSGMLCINNSTYKVGIVTASPGARFDLNQGSATSNRMRLSYTVANTYAELYCDTVSRLVSANDMLVSGILSVHDVGTSYFNVLNANANTTVEIGRSENVYDCMQLTFNRSGVGSHNNRLSFDPYGGDNGSFVVSNLYAGINVGIPNRYASFEIMSTESFMYSSIKYYNVATNAAGTYTNSSIALSAYLQGGLYVGDSIVQSSDRRLKSNITDYEISVDAYMKLMPKSYMKRASFDPSIKTESHQIGLIAQDVAPQCWDLISLCPDKFAVKESDDDPDDGVAMSIDYSKLSVVNLFMIKQILNRLMSAEI
jgi:hypothetical protein